MKTLTFIRHGQSVDNAGGITMEHAAIPLSDLGIAQAARLSELLARQPSAVYTSRFLRTQQTAQPYCLSLGVEPKVHDLLHELMNLDPIELQGFIGEQRKPFVDDYWKRADPLHRMGEGAESFADFDRRVTNFLPELEQLPHDAVFFGHGMWIALLIWKLIGFSASDSLGMQSFRRFQIGLPMGNGAVYHFNLLPGGKWNIQADEYIMRQLLAVN